MSETEHKVKPVLYPTSSLLEMHLEHIREECNNIFKLASGLEWEGPDTEERDRREGVLYAALCHLKEHIVDAIREWDQVTDKMPEDSR